MWAFHLMLTERRWFNLNIHSSAFHISLPVNGPVFPLVEHQETVCAFFNPAVRKDNGQHFICNQSPLFVTLRIVMCLRVGHFYVCIYKCFIQSDQRSESFWLAFVFGILGFCFVFLMTATLLVLTKQIIPNFSILFFFSPRIRLCLNLLLWLELWVRNLWELYKTFYFF